MSRSEDSGQIVSQPVGPAPRQVVNPAALTAQQMARLLGVPEETIRRHLASGAPAGPDGRMNLVHYAAWLNRELAKTDAD